MQAIDDAEVVWDVHPCVIVGVKLLDFKMFGDLWSGVSWGILMFSNSLINDDVCVASKLVQFFLERHRVELSIGCAFDVGEE